MPASKRKQLILAALTAGFLLLLLTFFMPPAPAREALHLSVLGPTNGPLGAPMVLVWVTNNTGRARYFYFCAEVPTPTGWADHNGWVERQGGLTRRLAAHAARRVLVPPPERAAKWRLRCSSSPDVSKIEWGWYLFVRRSGLSRVGFRSQPPGSYSWTAQVTQ
jgi:hypothetical protein